MAIRDPVDEARLAISEHAWGRALELLRPVAARLGTGSELELLGQAEDWSGELAAALDAWERAVGAYQAEGDRRAAARVALMLRHLASNNLADSAMARGWTQRAESLLQGLPECAEHAMLLRAQGRRLWTDGHHAEGLALLDRAIEVGARQGHAGIVAMSMSAKAICLALQGEPRAAFELVDEAAAMAAAGELGVFATGIVFCNAISVYREVGEFPRAAEWTETAARWCARRSLGAFPGICRVHRAEVLRLRGDWAGAAKEALDAATELEPRARSFAGEAYYELAEVRFKLGDLAGAESALRLARERGHHCQPARATFLAEAGDPAAGWRSLGAVLEDPDLTPLERARVLPAAVELALAAGEAQAAAAAAAELQRLTDTFTALPVRAVAAQAQGVLQLDQDPASAAACFRSALSLFIRADEPYETAVARRWLGRALIRSGDRDQAAEEIALAGEEFQKLGARLDVERTAALLRGSGEQLAAVQRCLLFTDICGSTTLVEAIGDEAWSSLLAWHDQTLRHLFAAEGGEEVDHAGDGFFVAFADPSAAVRCAGAIQRRLAEHRRGHGFAPRVRIGVHLAEVAESGRGYRGRGVHLSARLAAAAEADQVLLSIDTARAAGCPDSPAQVFRLKGIRTPVEAVSLDWSTVTAKK